MKRIEMTEVDQRIAKVCDPATANRYEVVYHNRNTDERWLVARLLPGEVRRFIDALRDQGGELVIHQQQMSEWNVLRWLRVYRQDAPIHEIAANLAALD